MVVDSDDGGRYFAADYEQSQERERLRRLEAMSDRTTIRALDTVGVGPGWHCLEVGAGGGSVARLLGERVGPTGRVVAADLDPRFLDGHDGTTPRRFFSTNQKDNVVSSCRRVRRAERSSPSARAADPLRCYPILRLGEH